MIEKPKFVDFGAPEEFGAHLFRVEIPAARNDAVRIIEDFGLRGGDSGLPYEEVRAVLNREAWSAIAETARKNFNERLKKKKLLMGRWKVGTGKDAVKVDRLLGKELCVLAWAAENADKDKYPVICSKWSALRPEERWWLFSMTAAEAGLADDGDRGWRKALMYAMSDGKNEEKSVKRLRPAQEELTLSLFEA